VGAHVSHYRGEGTEGSKNDAAPTFSNLYHGSKKSPKILCPLLIRWRTLRPWVNFRGIYLGRNLASGNVKGTHFVTFVAENNAALTDGIMAMQTSDAMKSYVNAVIKSCTIIKATNVSIKLKRWSR
jgi:hypothetical protein